MAVILDCREGEEGLEALVKRIQSELAALGIAGTCDTAWMVEWLRREAERRYPIVDGVLMEGLPPIEPVDGRIEWSGNFFEAGFIVDDKTGAIDYRRHAAQRSVSAGQLLATVIPPVPGRDGRDVFGKRLTVRKPRPLRIRAGENVRWDEAGVKLYACTDGRIRWDQEVLSVDRVYRIEGSVGLASGNISHPGAVEVEEDVQEGAEIRAEGDVEVKQFVEAVDLKAGGDLTVRGGMMGGGNRRIRVGGGVHARFIMEADIEAGEDIIVEREISHCILKTRGAVRMPHGRLMGGEVIALGGIVIGQAGSVAAVPTVLVAGDDYQLLRDLPAQEKELERLEDMLSKTQASVQPFIDRITSLPESRQDAVVKLLRKANELRAQIDQIQEAIDAAKERSEKRRNLVVEIRQKVYPETFICMCGERFHVTQEIEGPLRAIVSKGKIELHGISPEERKRDAC